MIQSDWFEIWKNNEEMVAKRESKLNRLPEKTKLKKKIEMKLKRKKHKVFKCVETAMRFRVCYLIIAIRPYLKACSKCILFKTVVWQDLSQVRGCLIGSPKFDFSVKIIKYE